MLGASHATWIFLTDDKCDSVKGEILSSRVEHPALAQVGPFASALIGAFPLHVHTIVGVTPPEPCTLDSKVRVHEAAAPLIYRRGTINATVYIQRIHRTKERQKFLTPKDDETTDAAEAAWIQLAEDSAFANTPLTRFTFNAGAAIFTGTLWGAKQMAIDSGQFISDPTPRAATLAGITGSVPDLYGRERRKTADSLRRACQSRPVSPRLNKSGTLPNNLARYSISRL
jgi:hypothetical protein